MRSKNEIKKELDLVKQEYFDSFYKYKEDPEYKRLSCELESVIFLAKLRSKPLSEELEIKMNKLHDEYQEAIAAEAKKEDDKYGTEVNKLVKNLTSGVDWGPKGLVPVWMSEDRRFVILKNPGHSSWGDVLNPRVYNPTNHLLIDMVKFKEDEKSGRVLAFQKGVILERDKGRLNKAMMKDFEVAIEKARKERK